MTKLAWTPWHQVVHLRDDLRTGELSLAAFAADLYDVAMQQGRRRIYEEPAEFFALTYPTYNLRELARDVVQRLAGQNEKAVRQLELTYGGGKTHALTTLHHPLHDPAPLPDLPHVHQLVQPAGMPSPPARAALLTCRPPARETGQGRRGPGAEAGGTAWVGCSKWTSPQWRLAAIRSCGSVVVSAGGRGEGLDRAPLAAGSGQLRAVVAIGRSLRAGTAVVGPAGGGANRGGRRTSAGMTPCRTIQFAL